MCNSSCFDFFPQLKTIEQPGEWEREGKEEAFHSNKRGRKNNNDDSEFSSDNNLSNVLATTLLQPAIR